jgi:hypothetical protein
MSLSERFFGRAFLILALTGALLLVVACGGDDESTDGDSSEPTATRESGGEEEESTPDAGDGDTSGDDAASDLAALAGEYSDFSGVVKYETSGFGDESFSTMTIYRDGSNSRVDYEGTDGSGSFITNADGSFACAENQCLKYPAGQGIDPTAAFTAFINPETVRESFGEVPDGVDVDRSSEEIAGLDATCYTYSGDLDEEESGDESGKICFSDSGILLRLEFESASGSGKFEAVEASEGADDADFEPPFDVVDLGDFGQ